jgi:ribosomal protein L32
MILAKHLSAPQRRPSADRRNKRRIVAFSKRLTFSDLDGRTNAGKYVNSMKNDLEAQIGNPSPGQQILIKLVAIKMLRCEMMYEQVLSQPDGGDLQDRIENYFLAWSNSVRRDLQALGVLEATRNPIDELLKIAPADMSNEQLEIARAFCRRQLRSGVTPKRRAATTSIGIKHGASADLTTGVIGSPMA